MKLRQTTGRIAVMGAVVAMLLAACGSDKKTSTTTATTAGTVASASTTTGGDGTATTLADSTPSTSGGSTTVPAAMGGSLTVGMDGDTSCGYVPSLCSVSYGPGASRFAVLENLVRPAANSDGYEDQLAEKIVANADFTEFTFTLKKDVKWSDGTPFTAGDVKTLFDNDVMTKTSFLRGNVSLITATDAPDDNTVVFHLSAPQAPFPVLLTNVPIWKSSSVTDKTSLPIGTGPFVFSSYEPNVKLVLKKNTNYWGKDAAGNQLPYLDEVTIVPIVAGDARVNAVQKGDIDIAMSVDPLISKSLAGVSTIHEVDLNAGNGLFFNNSSAPTDDLRVRTALAMATNKDDVVAAIGLTTTRDEFYTKDSPWYSKAAHDETPVFDVDGAKKLIQEYMNDPTRSDKQPVGTPVSIDIAYVQGAVTAESIATVAQQQWKDIGVTVSVTPKDQSTLIKDAIAGNFNVNYFAWATPHPYSLLVRNFGHWPETQSNYTHFNNDELIALVAEMSKTAPGPAMDALIQKSDEIIAKGVPLIFLHSTPLVWGAGKKVGNLDLLPGNGFLDWTTLSAAA